DLGHSSHVLPGASRLQSWSNRPSLTDLSHHHAAPRMNVLPRQPPRLFADHTGHDIGNVLRRAEPLERRGLLADLADGGIGGHHGRVCVPWATRIHGDSL